MALADLDSIQFYQPPTKASLTHERVPKALNATGPPVVGEWKPPKALGPSDRWSALWDDEAIEFIDITDSPPREHLSPFRESAPDLKDTEVDARDTSNGPYNTGDLDHNISEDHDDLPPVEDLLLNAGETRKSEQAGLSREHKKGLLEHTIQEDCGGVTTLDSRRSEKMDEPTVLNNDHSEGDDVYSAEREAAGDSDSSGYNSDCSTADGQFGESDTPDTQPISVGSSGDGCSSLHEKNVRSAFNTPPPYLKDLSSTPANRACESQDGDRIGPSPSAGEDRENQWDRKEAEAGEEEDEKEETEDVGDRDESQTPPLRATKKRPLSPAKEKSCVKRRTKRRRFSSPLSSDEETEMGDESDISSYKPHHISDSRPTPSHSTDLEGDTSDDGTRELPGGRSDRRPRARMAVIYERQSWEGEIIDEKDVKQGRGRPRKQYLVRWKQSWVDGGHLSAPELLQNWREKKALRSKR